MTIKGVFLFLLLLLSSGTSFSFPNDTRHLDEQETSGIIYEFEEEAADLYQGTVPGFKTHVLVAYPLIGSRNFLFQSSYETQFQQDYIRRSKNIFPGLDVPDIIFPFHVFY